MKLMKKAALPILIAVALAGCSSGSQEHSEAHRAPNGDFRETTASFETLPTFLQDQDPMIRNAYLLVGQNTEMLDWMPCYCGCGESAGHQNSKNCFIYEVEDSGSVVWDDHGTRCMVCIQIAVESVLMQKQGHSIKEIRNAIDEKYKDGLAAPTPTPMPL